MRKNYGFTRFMLSSTLVLGTFVFAPSCVNTEYDLDKDIEMDVNIGGDFTLPLGSTLPTYLRDLLDPDEIEYLEELDGVYKISMSDNISVEIDELTSEDIVIDGVSPEIDPITIAFTKPTIDPFNISIPDDEIDVKPGIASVDLGSGTSLNQTINAGFDLEGLSIPSIGGAQVPATTIILGIPAEDSKFTINASEGIVCPDQVISLSDIKIGSTVYVDMDLSSLGNRFTAESFSFELDYIQFTFPEGFVIDGGTNVVRKENLVNEGNYVSFDFTITGYDKTVENIDGVLTPAIGGDVICEIDDSFTASGTTQTNSESGTNFTISIKTDEENPIAVSDMMLEVDNITVTVEDMNLGEAIEMELPETIEKVNSITLEESARTLYIDITSIELPDGLVPTGANMVLKFPSPLFNLYNAVAPVDGYNEIELSMSDLLTGTDIKETVEIYQLVLEDEPIVESVLSIEPGIVISGTTIAMAGELSLTAFNDFIAGEQKIKTSVSTSSNPSESSSLEVADAEVVVSSDAFAGEIEPIETDIAAGPVVIPDELVRIDSLNFKTAVMAPINISVPLEGIDATLKFSDYTIEFPKFLRFKDPEANGIDSDNKLVINDEFTLEKDSDPYTDDYGVHKFNKVLYIEALDFSSYDPNELITTNEDGDKVLVIDESVKISGSILLDGGDSGATVVLEDLADSITADVNFSIGEMTIKEVYGEVSPAIECEGQEIDLSELTEMFDGDLSATLASPSITFTASNSLSIPIVIDRLELTPYKSGQALTAATLAEGEKILIAAAEQDGVAFETKIIVTSDEIPDVPEEGVSYVKIDGLTTLLDGLPDKVIFDYNAGAYDDGENNHMIDLTQSGYAFGIDYSLDIPLAFEELSLEYTTEMEFEDMGDSISSMTDYVSSIELELIGTNTLPLGITITEITPVDADGNTLSKIPSIIDSEANTLAANGESTIKASLSDVDGQLSEMGGLKIGINAEVSSTAGGQALSPDQYFKFEIVARISDGINISMSSDDDE